MITPLDIKKHEFSRVWRGYDPDEVHALLDAIAREFEESNRRNVQLSEQLRTTEEESGRYRMAEKTLQDAAVTLQKMLEEKRRAAEQEVALMLQDARQRAEEELRTGREQAAVLRAEIRSLEDMKTQFHVQFRNLLRTQAQMLDSMLENVGTDPATNDSRGADGEN